MNISDILFNQDVSSDVKQAVLDTIISRDISYDCQVLTPTDSNDDVNGSQHARNGGTDFTYRDATSDDIYSVSGIGYYEYFSNYGSVYTGHYYDGDRSHFAALVINPPAYAIAVNV